MNRPPHLPPLPDEARLVFRSAGPSEHACGAGEAGAGAEGGWTSGFAAGEEPASLEELLARPLNWHLVVLLAEREKAVARLHHLLAQDHSEVVPEGVLAHLGRVAQVEAFRAMVLEQRLEQLLDGLEEAEVPVLLLKGAAMARTIYPSFAQRPMGDLDLLVHPAHAGRARKVAEGLGWRLPEGFAEEAFPEADHHHLPPLTDGTALNLGLDLHTRISGTWEPPGFSPEDLWARAPRLPGRTLVQVPDPADLLLHVCHHFAWSHSLAFGGWKAFRDTALLVGHGALDHEAFQERVNAARVGPLVAWTFRMAWGVGGVPVPGPLLDPGGRPWRGAPLWTTSLLVRHFSAVLAGLDGSLPPRWVRQLWELALRPERMGVNGRRPWSHDEAFHGLRSAPEVPESGVGIPSPGPGSELPAEIEGEPAGPHRLRALARHAGWVLRPTR